MGHIDQMAHLPDLTKGHCKIELNPGPLDDSQVHYIDYNHSVIKPLQ